MTSTCRPRSVFRTRTARRPRPGKSVTSYPFLVSGDNQQRAGGDPQRMVWANLADRGKLMVELGECAVHELCLAKRGRQS
jgi:hypothetical protein